MQVPLQIDQVYKIVVNHTQNLCISVKQNDPSNPLILLQFQNQQNQLWRLLRTRQDTYRLQSVKYNSFITFDTMQQEEVIRAATKDDKTTNQEWMITKIDKTNCSIRIRHFDKPGLSLNAKGSELQAESQIILYQFANATNDVWSIIEM